MADSIAQLAERWSFLLVSSLHESAPPVAPIVGSGSVLRGGASEDAIAAAERHLGVDFPADYRAFLRYSDGAFADAGGVITELDVAYVTHMPEPGIGLLPVAQVRPVVEVEAWWTDMWVEGHQGFEPDDPPDWSEVTDMRPLANGLLISSIAQTNRMVLVPVVDRWEVWVFSKDGATRHISFAAWLRFEIARLQPAVASPQELRALLDRAAAGDEHARLDVLKVADPSLAGIVIEALGDPALRGFVLPIVERWPSDAVVGALDAAIEAHASADPLIALGFKHLAFTKLMSIGTEHAETVLRSHGATLHADTARKNRSP